MCLIMPCGAQTFCGWLYGQFPPALFGSFRLAGANLLNMFRAHEAAYQAIKALPGSQQGSESPCFTCLCVPSSPRLISTVLMS